MKKIETAITLANEGLHSPARYRAFKKIILNNDFQKARLYQFILKGSTAPDAYSKAADGIARFLRKNDIRCTGKGCWEVDDDKGLHFHFFVLVEGAHGRVDHWLNPAEDGPLKTMLRTFGVTVHIAPPRNAMHRTMTTGEMPLYQYVSKSGPKLEDAVLRVSYLFKNRSKDLTMKRIYYSTRSRPAAPAAPANAPEQAQDAPAAPAHTNQPVHAQAAQDAPEQAAQATNEQEETMPLPTLPLSPVGFAYLGDIYEEAVDAGLNLIEIQAHLSKRGIHKGLLAIRYDLDHVFSFAGYAASHPAPAYLTLAEIDAVLQRRQPARLIEKVLVATSKRSYNGRNNTHTTGH
jgi:hypothetical protein